MSDDLRADLDEFFFQASQRPVFDRLRCSQRAQEVEEIVSERVKLNQPLDPGTKTPVPWWRVHAMEVRFSGLE